MKTLGMVSFGINMEMYFTIFIKFILIYIINIWVLILRMCGSKFDNALTNMVIEGIDRKKLITH